MLKLGAVVLMLATGERGAYDPNHSNKSTLREKGGYEVEVADR